jgi:hypothetical protein
MADRLCAICARPTNSACNDGHAVTFLCPPELRDCFYVHLERKHGKPYPPLRGETGER